MTRDDVRIGELAAWVYRPAAASAAMPVFVGMGDRDITVSERGIRKVVHRAPDAVLRTYDADYVTVFAQPALGEIIRDQVAFLRDCGLLEARRNQ